MDDIPYRLPLVIGATGHRDLRDQDIPALENAVGEVIKRLKDEYLEGDPETPIVLLSSLAEGADQLAARVALDHGLHLIVPLPMVADEYRYDFETSDNSRALAEFNHLLAKAVAVPVMPFVAGNTLHNVREEPRRALQYREVGLFIVRHCDVLIALWNGDERDPAVGGTAEVVSFRRNGIPPDAAASVRTSLDALEMGPVIHILTPRAQPGGNVMKVATEPWGIEFVARYRAMHSLGREQKTLGGSPAERRERRRFESWIAFEAKAASTCWFNREAANLGATSNDQARLNASLSHMFSKTAASIIPPRP